MRKIALIVSTFLYRAKHIFDPISIRGRVMFCKISLAKNNKVIVNSEMSYSTLCVHGNNNILDVSGIIQHVELTIEGSNNRLFLEDGCSLRNSCLLIRGENSEIVIGPHSDVLGGCLICQGRNTYIHIGEDCLFSHDLEIWNSDTHTIYNSDGLIINHSKSVEIGDHVWTGKHVKILKGVTIGNNVVIGMGSVVSKDLPDNSINVGSPAKTIKEGISWSRELVDYEN